MEKIKYIKMYSKVIPEYIAEISQLKRVDYKVLPYSINKCYQKTIKQIKLSYGCPNLSDFFKLDKELHEITQKYKDYLVFE